DSSTCQMRKMRSSVEPIAAVTLSQSRPGSRVPMTPRAWPSMDEPGSSMRPRGRRNCQKTSSANGPSPVVRMPIATLSLHEMLPASLPKPRSSNLIIMAHGEDHRLDAQPIYGTTKRTGRASSGGMLGVGLPAVLDALEDPRASNWCSQLDATEPSFADVS